MSNQTRKVWLSKVDALALLRARDVFDLLAERLPLEEAKVRAYHVLQTRLFRRRVRDLFIEAGEESLDHLLLEIPRDMYLVLKAMGLCGSRDARGRRICLPLFSKGWLSLYRVLIEQFGILFDMRPVKDVSWTPENIEQQAHRLFSNAGGEVSRGTTSMEHALRTLYNAAYALKTYDARTVMAKIRAFGEAASSFEAKFGDVLLWWLEKKELPGNETLTRFRKAIGCEAFPDATEQSGTLDVSCETSLQAHARLFRARLVESVVMEALSMIPSELSGRSSPIYQGLNNLINSYHKNLHSDLPYMRLLWAQEPLERHSVVRSLGSFTKPATSDLPLRLGLSSRAVWGGTGNLKAVRVHDSLTLATKNHSWLHPGFSHKQGGVLTHGFIHADVANASKETNAVHSQSLVAHLHQPIETVALCHLECQGGAAVPDRERDMLGALLLHWKAAGSPHATQDFLPVVAGHRRSGVNLRLSDVFRKFTPPSICGDGQGHLHKAVKACVGKLNAFASDPGRNLSNARREMYISFPFTESGGTWDIPLTQARRDSLGMYNLVVWMLCQDRVIVMPCSITGRLVANGHVVQGSEQIEPVTGELA